ncbi:type II toxin-antitoxin system HicA family toxin [Maritimibacter sp. HL-12]|uniref:type II toxin-antitoxin system HicA family toxin n=1 Tax=Maritimibacter sp. HL-12 TaxID=1162418 RepID=UPI000A1CD56D
MVDGFQKQVIKELKRLGYYRDGGSKHPKWCHDGGKPTIMVPHKILSKHTAKSILEEAGSDLKL